MLFRSPYILSMGTEETATRRLNLAQSFNPMGSLLGMYVAMQFIQAKLHPMGTDERALLNDSEFQAIKESDLAVLIAPYLIIGLVILAMLLLIRFVKMPKNGDQNHKIDFFPTLKRIFKETRYREGVQLAFEEIRRSAPALLLVDMTMYANAESTFMEYVSRNRTLLSNVYIVHLAVVSV